MSKPREWWIVGDLAEEDTSEPFEGATLAIEKSAYDALAAENEKLKNAISEGGFEFALARTSLDLQRDIDLHELRAANAELVEALQIVMMDNRGVNFEMAKQALAKHGGDK